MPKIKLPGEELPVEVKKKTTLEALKFFVAFGFPAESPDSPEDLIKTLANELMVLKVSYEEILEVIHQAQQDRKNSLLNEDPISDEVRGMFSNVVFFQPPSSMHICDAKHAGITE